MEKIVINRLKEDDLKKLAVDFHHGKIFTDRNVSSPEMVKTIFMPVLFMEMSEKEAKRVGLIYEYIDKAGPRSINGMPMFTSCRLLAKEDLPLLYEYMEKLRKAENDALKEAE